MICGKTFILQIRLISPTKTLLKTKCIPRIIVFIEEICNRLIICERLYACYFLTVFGLIGILSSDYLQNCNSQFGYGHFNSRTLIFDCSVVFFLLLFDIFQHNFIDTEAELMTQSNTLVKKKQSERLCTLSYLVLDYHYDLKLLM